MDCVFVMILELGFEVNLIEWLKMSFIVGYCWVNGVICLEEFNNDDFSSLLGIIIFWMGGFESDF